MVVLMAFNPARAVGFLHGHGHTQEQAQAVVEVLQDSQDDLVTKAYLDLAIARLEARFTRLLWLQLGAYTAAAVGAIVVAGVLWG